MLPHTLIDLVAQKEQIYPVYWNCHDHIVELETFVHIPVKSRYTLCYRRTHTLQCIPQESDVSGLVLYVPLDVIPIQIPFAASKQIYNLVILSVIMSYHLKNNFT